MSLDTTPATAAGPTGPAAGRIMPAPVERACCDEGARAAALTRRQLLGAVGAAGAGAVLSGVVGDGVATQYAFAAPGSTGDVVVVLSLRGGFDGLSAVAPVGDPYYARARPTIGVPASKGVTLDRTFALHPALKPLKALYDRKQLAFVHAVGQQNATRSHFADMERMENAAPGSHLRTGWLDRMVGLSDPSTFGAIALGSASAPASLRGPAPELAVASVADFGLYGAKTDVEFRRWSTALTALNDSSSPVHGSALAGLRAAATGRTLLASARTAAAAGYPATPLGESLHDVAMLVQAGIGLRVATVDVGDWDMHVGQGRVDNGWMARRLDDLARSLTRFAAELGSHLGNVTLVTLSEFGRRVAENGSGGTDHGHGNVSLVLGGGIRGGRVYGSWPGLAPDRLDNGDLAGTTDYRAVLAEILEKRAKVSVATVFPELDGTRLGLAAAKG